MADCQEFPLGSQERFNAEVMVQDVVGPRSLQDNLVLFGGWSPAYLASAKQKPLKLDLLETNNGCKEVVHTTHEYKIVASGLNPTSQYSVCWHSSFDAQLSIALG